MASRNQSNKEKTIKTTLITMQNDFWTIDNVMLNCNYLDAVILPDGFILDEYRDYFENFLVDIDVPEEYHYSPSLFSEIQYGTPDLDFLILYFAKMTSLFDFNQPTIKFLPITSLSDLNKLIVESRVIIRNSRTNPTVYNRLEQIKLPIKGYFETGSNIITITKEKSAPINKESKSESLNSNNIITDSGSTNEI